MALTLRAHAKLNLVLSVGPPEPAGGPCAGWHPIASWMAPIDLCDEVTLETMQSGTHAPAEIRFADDAPRPGPIDWPPERDLAWRALRALEMHLGRTLPTRIRILKRIPTGSGLGGGSSNAASTLLGLCRLHAIELPEPELVAIGSRLGSDVPFFLDGSRESPRPALVLHMGERIERLTPIHAEVVLVVPPFECATPAVYKAYDAQGPRSLREADVRSLTARHVLDPGSFFNDLADPACAVAPELGRLLARAREVSGLPVHVTGSGSTLFIITPPERSHALAARLAEDPLLAGCALVATHLADRGADQSAPSSV